LQSTNLRGLYALSDEKLTPYDKIEDFLRPAFLGGVKIFQLRDKNNSDEFLLPIALKIQALCKAHGVLFVIDDRIELALEIEADGLHIGEHDISLKEARAKYDGIIGLSCYGDIDRAVSAEKEGADYVAFGSFYPSPTKPNSKTVPLSTLSEAKKRLNIPVCAIGGIKEENMAELISAGADTVALISELWSASDIEKKARALSSYF